MYKDAPLPIRCGMQNTRPGRGAEDDAIVVAVPVELKGLVGPLESLIRKARKAIGAARGGGAINYASTEEEIAERVAEIECATHASILAAVEVDSPRIEINGKVFARIGYAPGRYFTMSGSVVIERAVYREMGVRNGPSVDAISLRIGTFGRGWLPKTAGAIAHFVQQLTSREAFESARQIGRLPYSRASFERVAHAVGEEWLPHQANIEDALIEGLEIPDDVTSIGVALDRVSLPMEEPAKRKPGRPRKGAPKRPIKRPFRMAYCGTVTLHDKDGNCLHTIRRGCMPESSAELLCLAMANDVYRLLERCPGLPIRLLADGAPEMWNLLEAAFPESAFGEVTRGVDFWHLIEKLAPAAKVVFGDEDADDGRRRWKRSLLRSDGAAAKIRDELRASGHEKTWRDSEQPVRKAITYIDNHLERMRYATARKSGLPIGSGSVEATCKTLVAVRMKRAGSRWKHQTGEHLLQLRALALSDRFDAAMTKLHERRRTAVRPAA